MKYDIDSLENRDPQYILDTVEWMEPLLRAWFDPVVTGLHRIPQGPGIYVGNHNGGLAAPDIFVMGLSLVRARGVDDLPFGLAHELPLKLPVSHAFLVKLGAVRASHENAHAILEAGAKLLVYPGGDIDSMRPWHRRHRVVFGARRGYMKLALREGVPVVPVVTAGAHEGWVVLSDGRRVARALRMDKLLRLKVLPITLSLPYGITLGAPVPYLPVPTKVFQTFLDPIRFARSGPDAAEDSEYVEACHRTVHRRMQRALIELYRRRKIAGRWPAWMRRTR